MTPTPLSYKVVKGDDMFGIALRHGISLAVLLTANPTVNPSFLSVGTILQIPQTQATPKPGESTPVPIPVELSTPACYPTGEGGLWCLILAGNSNERAVENLSVSVLVSNSDGTSLQQQEAFPLLYILPAGSQTALGAYFPPPAPGQAVASASLAAAFYQPENDSRYLDVSIQGKEVLMQPGGLAAQVRGSLMLVGEANPAGEVWVAAAAFDADGRPVGLRRWESSAPLEPGGKLQFDFTIYSLGPEIARVELMAEAHTSLESQAGTPALTPAN